MIKKYFPECSAFFANLGLIQNSQTIFKFSHFPQMCDPKNVPKLTTGTGSINMALSVWLVCGLFSMVGAYCYAELGCMIKKAGGDYSYILDTFGPFIGFIRLWAECLIVRPCTIAIVGLTFATYATKPFFPECNPPDEAIRCLAAVCICKSIPRRYPNSCRI